MAVKESYAGKINRKLNKKLHVIDVAAGRVPADLVLKNATYVNVFSNELCRGDIAVAEGLIVGMGEYHGKVEADVGGKIVLPGFIDAHIHLESSLVSPKEFAKAVLPHGTTTVITDPHEILGGNATQNPGKVSARRLPPTERRAIEILEAKETMTKAEIRKCYKALIKVLHPDMNGGDRSQEEMLQEVVWAWDQIKDSRNFK